MQASIMFYQNRLTDLIGRINAALALHKCPWNGSYMVREEMKGAKDAFNFDFFPSSFAYA